MDCRVRKQDPSMEVPILQSRLPPCTPAVEGLTPSNPNCQSDRDLHLNTSSSTTTVETQIIWGKLTMPDPRRTFCSRAPSLAGKDQRADYWSRTGCRLGDMEDRELEKGRAKVDRQANFRRL